MNSFVINRWKDSASESLAQNKLSVLHPFCFEITKEQKEYLEYNTNEINWWCKKKIGMMPVTIKFVPFWNGMENVFTCDCYFG